MGLRAFCGPRATDSDLGPPRLSRCDDDDSDDVDDDDDNDDGESVVAKPERTILLFSLSYLSRRNEKAEEEDDNTHAETVIQHSEVQRNR